jgi:hypothetical protein
MTADVFDVQGRIFGLFGALGVLEDVEWSDSITDNHDPNMCPCCGGFQSSRHFSEMVGHRDECELVAARGALFREAVMLASGIPDGNSFLNMVTALHLSRSVPRW